jgi:glycosyltransferase involved in cell wall biosynthesis
MVRRPGKLAPAVLWRTLTGRRSYAIERHASPEFAAAVRDVAARISPDVVQLETFLMGQYLADAGGRPAVLDMHNVTWRIWDRTVEVAKPWLRPALAVQARRVRADEIAVCRAVDVCAPVSDTDLVELRKEVADVRAVIVTPGVDCDLLRPMAAGTPRQAEILFVGSMSYPPNIDAVTYFCRDILPRIAAIIPDARLSIVGAQPPPSVSRLADGDRIRVTGFVPDVRPYYEAAAAVVVPLRVGGGIRMKILEGLALAAPMVSTSIGAEGLGLADGEELLLADTPESFAAAVVRLMRQPELRQHLARRARETAVRRFSWDAVGETLNGIYESIAPAARRTEIPQKRVHRG